jgi:hypothetical protein
LGVGAGSRHNPRPFNRCYGQDEVFMRSFAAVLLVTLAGVASSASAEGLNPPPAAAFGTYRSYELKPLAVSAELKASETGVKATNKIQENLDARLKPLLEGWTKMAEGKGGSNTLVFEPAVDDLRFIGGAKRVFAGALAGSSHVVLKLKITEQPSGKVIGEPEFFQRASGVAGAWTFGAHDNTMLSRVVELAANYMSQNFTGAVGGLSGREEEKKK